MSFKTYLALLLAIFTAGFTSLAGRAEADTPPITATASSRGAAQDISDLDRILSRSAPGDTDVYVGDMRFEVAALQRQRDNLAARLAAGQSGPVVVHSAFDPSFRAWPGGNVPYAFDPGVPAGQQSLLIQGCNDWAAVANLHFFPRTTEANYIVFQNSTTGNNSYVGVIGGGQPINIQDYQEFLIAHEVGHALGLIHEQSRSDRDAYVTINNANIPPAQQFNFDIVPGSLNQGPYDFDSIMHYFLTAFSTNGMPTITVNPPYDAMWNGGNVGTETHLSVLDKAGMAAIYGPPGPQTNIYYVSPTGNDNRPGSLTSPFRTIQGAVNTVPAGAVVIVEDGTYSGPGNVDVDFGGKNLTLTSQNGAASAIMDCQGSAASNHRGFYFHSGETSAVVSGLTIKNGYEAYASNGPVSAYGGGVCIINSSVTLQNCILSGNYVSHHGGGVYSYNAAAGAVTMMGCTFASNVAGYGGGGVYNANGGAGTMTLTGCTFTSNIAQYDGGGVSNFNGGSGAITLTNCAFTGNMAVFGASVNNYNSGSGAIMVTGSTMTGNIALFGSNVDNYSSGGLITLTNCILYGDTGVEISSDPASSSPPFVSFCDVQGGYGGVGGFSADPQFVNAANGDLHLKRGSPCLGAGTVGGAPATTLDGQTRPDPPSMGAYDRPNPSDLNGDGRLDLVWQNTKTGDVVYWLMNGAKETGSGSIAQGIPTEWKIVGTPDLNSDGRPDLLWQNNKTGDVVYWLMNGGTQVGSGVIAKGIPTDWKIVGTPDLNGDGHPDLIWQNNQTGDVVYWLMNGTTQTGSGSIAQGMASEWKIVGTPDLNGDGHPDLLWQNQTTGDVMYWLMNGGTQVGGGSIAQGIPTQWKIVGTPDLNGDGHPDLIWQNNSTGDVVYWLMNGATQVGNGSIAQGIPTEWKIAGIH